MNTGTGPLSGTRIIELVGIGPGPYAGELLAGMGAEVVAIERADSWAPPIHDRNKKSVVLNLRDPRGAQAVLQLCETADAIFEGMRPGVAERLGVGPAACQARNSNLVYGRVTGWGQTGPWATKAGHDINYIGITGALHAIGDRTRPPPPPLNLLGDFGGGSTFLVMGMLACIIEARATGKGGIVDASVVSGTNSMMSVVHRLSDFGAWTPERQANLLDGGAPFYRCYTCADGMFVAVGCIEPKFFAAMLAGLDIDASAFGGQNDRDRWPGQHALLEDVFASQPRDHWATVFENTDACVTPVLTYEEAANHPQIAAVAGRDSVSPTKGGDTRDVLAGAGFAPDEVASLIADGIAVAPAT